jgi:pantoate--beta-alanine ligase
VIEVVRELADLRRAVGEARSAGRRIGFVPTMGALHEGHLSLMRLARQRSDFTVVSIFVNPLQFGPSEDLDRYPRDEERDLHLCEETGVDLAFLPRRAAMYPEGAVTTVDVGPIGDVLEGAERPGHFAGVATVVAKLFNLVEPHLAVFGRKDAQQVAVIRQLVRDLSFDIEIIVGDIVREADDLALSSRNVYLRGEERAQATALHRALRAGGEAWRRSGEVEETEQVMKDFLEGSPGVELGYARAVDPISFLHPAGEAALLLVAARVGATRLIDNLTVTR